MVPHPKSKAMSKIIVALRTFFRVALPYFKCSVKKDVSLAHGIRFTRS